MLWIALKSFALTEFTYNSSLSDFEISKLQDKIDDDTALCLYLCLQLFAPTRPLFLFFEYGCQFVTIISFLSVVC